MNDDKLDALLASSDHDLDDALDASLNVDSGLEAITGPVIPKSFTSAPTTSRSKFQRRAVRARYKRRRRTSNTPPAQQPKQQ